MPELLQNRSEVTVVLVFFIVLAIVGIAVGGFFVRDYAQGRASAAWPVVDGVVLSDLDGDGTRLRYAYSIAGKTYESRRTRVFSARFLKSALRDYAPGEDIQVYVNPDNHAFSVLQPGGAGGAFIFFSILSGLAVFLGLGGVVWTLVEGASAEFAFADEGQADDG
jgi:hypothetical protein